jgi:Mg-chelatase subunit ChlD
MPDQNDPRSPTSKPVSPLDAPPARRRALSYALIGAAAITAAVALAAQGRSRPVATVLPPIAPIAAPGPAPQPAPLPAPAVLAARRPRVELVFALDTTGSMTGLIEGAKRKIWSLASFVAQGQPTPELRVGLVAYRDVGDAYVTRVHDLDDDLDRVYQRLQRFRADGGGDTPEHVGRALHEAVHQMSWAGDAEVVKIVYLVGDAPPHSDYRDGFSYERAARAAARKGIQVHTVRCGNDLQTETVWREIARLGGGQFMTIEQDGGMRDERTPYDDELARLHDELGATAVAYGVHRGAVSAARTVASLAPASVKAERARFLAAKGKAVGGRGDLLEATRAGTVKLEELRPEELPADLRLKNPYELKAALAEKEKARAELVLRIDALSRKRQRHLEADAAAASKAGAADGFDMVAKKALRQSVADKPAAGLKL